MQEAETAETNKLVQKQTIQVKSLTNDLTL